MKYMYSFVLVFQYLKLQKTEFSIETAILHGLDPFNLTDLEYATQY